MGEGDKEKKRESLKKTLTIRENDIHSKHNSCPSIWLCVFDEIRWKQKGTEKTKNKEKNNNNRNSTITAHNTFENKTLNKKKKKKDSSPRC